MDWAKQRFAQEPQSKLRLRHYQLLTDHAIQWDWLNWPYPESWVETWESRKSHHWAAEGMQIDEVLVNLGCLKAPESTIAYWLDYEKVLDRKLGQASRNPYYRPALSTGEYRSGFEAGMSQARAESQLGAYWVAVRPLNPAADVFAAMQLFLHAGIDLRQTLDPLLKNERLESVCYAAERSIKKHPYSQNPQTNATFYAGYDFAFALGMVCGLARESVFSLLSGLSGYAIAFVAELLQPGTREYISMVHQAPAYWLSQNTTAFGLPAVFQLPMHHDYSGLHTQLALTHLHSRLIGL